MNLSGPEDLLKAIDLLLLTMEKPQRKLFLQWIKTKRKVYDFNFPNGKKLETLNAEQNNVATNILVPNQPDGIIPVTEPLIVPDTTASVTRDSQPSA